MNRTEVSENITVSVADPPFIAALDGSVVALAHMQQVSFLDIDHLTKFNNLQPLFFTLVLHLMEHPGHLGYIFPQAVPDCVAVFALQTRLLQQPIKDIQAAGQFPAYFIHVRQRQHSK